MKLLDKFEICNYNPFVFVRYLVDRQYRIKVLFRAIDKLYFDDIPF